MKEHNEETMIYEKGVKGVCDCIETVKKFIEICLNETENENFVKMEIIIKKNNDGFEIEEKSFIKAEKQITERKKHERHERNFTRSRRSQRQKGVRGSKKGW